jgi:hypothetical protein
MTVYAGLMRFLVSTALFFGFLLVVWFAVIRPKPPLADCLEVVDRAFENRKIKPPSPLELPIYVTCPTDP